MSRCLRTKIPVATSLLLFKIVDACAVLTNLQSRSKYYYDRANSKSLPPLREGDVVCYHKNKIWNKSVVSNVRNEPGSYLVRNEHNALRRNCRYLYNTYLKPPVSNKRHLPHCYQGNRPMQSSNVVTVDSALLAHFGQRAFDPVYRKDTVLYLKNNQVLLSHERKPSYKK